MPTAQTIPVSVLRTAQRNRDAKRPWQLLIILDGYAYTEVSAISKASFAKHLAAWKAETYPTLKRSSVRYFLATPTDATETKPSRL